MLGLRHSHQPEKVLLTDFFVAEREEAASIASGKSRNADYSTKNADNSVLAALWGALDETADYSRLAGDDFLIETGSVEGPWVFDLPTELIICLSDLPEAEFSQIADRWASSKELSYYGASGADMIPSLVTVKQLAEKAHSSKCRLMLRMAM